jgi:hypothetical protein
MSQPTRSREFCGRALEQPEKLWAEGRGDQYGRVADSGKVPGNDHLYLSSRHSSLEAAGSRNISANMKVFPPGASWQQPLLPATGG